MMTQRGSEATIYSVADAAGVSIATVSRVLQGTTVVSEGTRQKVLAAVDDLNYMPVGAARSLAVRHHEALGLVLPELSGPYYSELLMGFEAKAAELGLSVVVALSGGKSDPSLLMRRLAARVDGLVVMGAVVPPEMLVRTGVRKPLIVVAGVATPGLESIGAENVESAEELTGHLIGHGRGRLLFVGDPDIAPDVSDRYRGFVRAHESAGLPAAEPVRIPFRENEGQALADRILDGELDADALVCANDELAISIMDRLQRAGRRVPDDIAVVGWDDVMTARYVRPGLTTVRQPVHELGRLAAERLHERVAGKGDAEPGHRLLPTSVVVRGSCGCA